jgi:N-acetylmuramoyl-L-alanine amidase
MKIWDLFFTIRFSALLRVALITTIVALVSVGFPVSMEAATAKKIKKSIAIPILSSEQILEAEQRLSDLGYWTGPVDGDFDNGSRHALIAFQKATDRKRTGRLNTEELQALKSAERPKPYEVGEPHIEVDLSRQILFVVDSEGMVSNILPVSSGSGKFYNEGGEKGYAITPTGRFTVYRKIIGWRKSPLGLLYYPNYIYNGIAIHGNSSVPSYPASHGCLRIPMFAATEFSKITPIGTVVIVHEGLIRTKPQ